MSDVHYGGFILTEEEQKIRDARMAAQDEAARLEAEKQLLEHSMTFFGIDIKNRKWDDQGCGCCSISWDMATPKDIEVFDRAFDNSVKLLVDGYCTVLGHTREELISRIRDAIDRLKEEGT